MAHIQVGNIFLKSNEEIVVRNPKSKLFFYYTIYSLLSCLLCVILHFFYNFIFPSQHASHITCINIYNSLKHGLYLHTVFEFLVI